MPRSDRPRKPRGTPKWQTDMAAFDRFMASDEPFRLDPNPPRRTSAEVVSAQPAEPARAARRLGRGGKLGLVAGGAALGGGALVLHRRRRNRMQVNKAMDLPFRGVRTVPMLVPTGRNVGRGLDIEHVVNRGASPRRNGLTYVRKSAFGQIKAVGRGARQHRGKIGLGAGAGTAYAFDRSTGGHDTRERFRSRNKGLDPARWEDDAFAEQFNARTRRDRERYRSGGSVRKAADIPFKRVASVQPRTPQGKYVGRANDVQVFHPKFKTISRQSRTSTLGHWKKGRDPIARSMMSKAEDVSGRRRLLATTGGWHPVFAGKPGKRLEAFGSTTGHGLAGLAAGNLAARGAGRVVGVGGGARGRAITSALGAHAGFQHAVGSNQRKGRLKTDYSRLRRAEPMSKGLFYGGEELTYALTGTMGMGGFAASQGLRGSRL